MILWTCYKYHELICPDTDFHSIAVLRRCFHLYVMHVNGLMWDCCISRPWAVTMSVLCSTSKHVPWWFGGTVVHTRAQSWVSYISRGSPAVTGTHDKWLTLDCVWVCCDPHMNIYYCHCCHFHYQYFFLYVAVSYQVIHLSVQTKSCIGYIMSALVVLLWW